MIGLLRYWMKRDLNHREYGSAVNLLRFLMKLEITTEINVPMSRK